jgi:Asp-tRNA(Asn)/Glu-tRNA(Gln) amidotransferase A subunit family amidase
MRTPEERKTPRGYLEHAIDRQSVVGAWTHLDDGGVAQSELTSMDEGPRLLSGISIGVKDIIDVAGMKTGCGTTAYADNVAFADAAIVAALRNEGAVILGKTTTAELAYLTPPATRNPLDRERSPGGSSSGSAAAVADYQVDAAIGTQTAGSIIRPAAFCGIVGFKPSHGLFSLAGVKATSRSLDCIGWMARDVGMARRLWTAIAPSMRRPHSKKAKLALCRTNHWQQAAPELRTALEDLARAVGASTAAHLPAGLDAIHHAIMKFEMRNELTTERLQFSHSLSAQLLHFLNDDPVTFTAYRGALSARSLVSVDQIFGAAEILLTPAAPGEAVEYGTTGDPAFNRAWTVLGLPCITLPFASGARGLPIGVQLVAKHGDDELLFDTAADIESWLRGALSGASGDTSLFT